MTRTPEIELEFAEPQISEPCSCCGGLTVLGTGFVAVDGGAYAVYYLAYANTHPDHELALIVSVGDWGEDADENAREAFYCRLRPHEETGSYQLGVGDADESRWADVALLGKKLSRAEVLAHPLKTMVFAITDEIGAADPRVHGYFSRVALGDSGVPLECSWRLPDAIARLDDKARESDSSLTESFASLGARRFIRVLMAFPVGDEVGCWSHGIWLEVDRSTYERVRGGWDDPQAYMRLELEGVLANDLMVSGLPHAPTACAGVTVRVKAVEPNQVLRVVSASDEGLQRQLTGTWSKPEFIRFAVEHGYL